MPQYCRFINCDWKESVFLLSREMQRLSIIFNQKEIAYASFQTLDFRFTETTNEYLGVASLKWFQIDNQLPSAQDTVLLYPTILPQTRKEKEKDEKPKPVFFGTFCRSKDNSNVHN